MRVLLDENVDRRLRPLFDSAFEVITVIEHGWGGLTNGELLNTAQHEFDVLVTMDRNMPHQHFHTASQTLLHCSLSGKERNDDIRVDQEPTIHRD